MVVPDKDERRKYSRVAFSTDIMVYLQVGSKTVEAKGDSKDLSLKGIFVRTDDQFALDTTCEVQIYLTGSIDEIVLKINGRVARIGEGGVGIIFDSMDVDTYSHLKNIVNYNSTDNSA